MKKTPHFLFRMSGIIAVAWSSAALAQTSDTFNVTITLQDACELSTAPTDLDFGTVNLLNQDYDAASAIYVTCTEGAAFTLSLDDGANPDATSRRMENGGNLVSYRLYSDSGRTTLWGDGTTFGSTTGGTGTGVEQTVDVFGRVANADNASTPPAGAYSDIVTVTVTF
ncbi:spore coat U domain-containing protein [Algiphilus sp.]|uniref:Csu type fimbrial protein n=1 Tax=Algiphilus sp. TaxID=1872431 RepID=UPI003B52F077